MTISSLIAAQAVFDLYDYSLPSSPPSTKWIFQSQSGDPIYYGITEVNDSILVVFRGSTTVLDFIKDIEAIALPMYHDLIGECHPGAWWGMEEVLTNIYTQYNPQNIIFTGHSLGSMRATLALAWTQAMFPSAKLQPRICFGEPRSGFEKSANLANIPGSISYWNNAGNILECDPVYNIPFTFYPELYTHKTQPTLVDYNDGTGPNWGFVSRHYMGYYLKALQKTSLSKIHPKLVPPFYVMK